MIRRKIERISYIINGKDKEYAELKFWRRELKEYIKWYSGDGAETMYGYKRVKVFSHNEIIGACLTMLESVSKPRYLTELCLSKDAFIGKTVLDIGSGALPGATVFSGSILYCIEPLLSRYMDAGFPIHCYGDVKFVNSGAENMPFPSGYFDAIISTNAIDHVNNIDLVAKEVKRVLKRDGMLRMSINYHKPTKAEPVEFTDKKVIDLFGWVKGFKLIQTRAGEGVGRILNGDLSCTWGN